MTAQVSDSVLYQGKEFSIAGVNGTGLFGPEQYGIKPVAITSACWRGYWCVYRVADDLLTLDTAKIGFDEDDARKAEAGTGPILFGKAPEKDYYEHRSPDTGKVLKRYDRGFIYRDLAAPICYTGGLLLGFDFIRELYVHMGFHPAWKFREVHELIFQDGKLVQAQDCSDTIKQIRDKRVQEPQGPVTEEQISDWVRKCFSLDYRR